MSLDRRRASVKSLVNAFESRWEHPGCGCCLLPDPGASRRPRQRGCTSPASSRDSSPARMKKPKGSPPSLRKLNGPSEKEADQTLVSLLLVLHSGINSSMIAIDNKIEQAMDLEWALAVKSRVWTLAHLSSWVKDRNLLYLFRDTPEVADASADSDARLEEALLRDVSGVLHIIRHRLWKIVRDRRKHQHLLRESH